MRNEGAAQPTGGLALAVSRNGGPFEPVDQPAPSLRLVDMHDHPARELSLEEIMRFGFPQKGLHPLVNEWRRSNLRNLWRGAWRVLAARAAGIAHPYGVLWLVHHSAEHGELDLGLASMRVVTTAGVNKIVAALNASDTVTATTFKYHGLGTGTNAEASSDTALQTELTTEYATDNTRPTGTQTTGASNNVYRTAATITPDSGGTIAVTEHGVFSAASAGTLLDRSKFAAVNLVTPNDAIAATYDFTVAAGG